MTLFRIALPVFFCFLAVVNSSNERAFAAPAPSEDLVVVVQNSKPAVITTEKGTYCTLPLAKPADGPIRSAFGMRRHPVKKRKIFHKGIDIAAKRGSDVLAAASGKVIFSGWKKGYGKTVTIEHQDGLTTLYAHMDKLFIKAGQEVEEGSRIGAVGRTGLTTGAHLHFELMADGKHINPVPETGWKLQDNDDAMLAALPTPTVEPLPAAQVETALAGGQASQAENNTADVPAQPGDGFDIATSAPPSLPEDSPPLLVAQAQAVPLLRQFAKAGGGSSLFISPTGARGVMGSQTSALFDLWGAPTEIN